jgi:antitoxin component YwqK of YwqJK toxin-antitoxin module
LPQVFKNSVPTIYRKPETNGWGDTFAGRPVKLSKEDNEFLNSLAKLDGVNGELLEKRNGIFYLKDSDTPYTGKMFRLYKNGQKLSEGNFKNGKPDGLIRGWHKNGQKMSELNFKDGKEDGVLMVWHENGQKRGQFNYKNGKEDGVWAKWHENGQKAAEANFKDGEGVLGSVKFWNSKGEPVDSEEEAFAE